MSAVVLVNGTPASGKSTVARAIAAELGAPLLALDIVKEALFEELGTGDRDYNRLLGRASYRAIFALIGEFPAAGAVVVDAWFGFQPLETLQAHIAAAKVRPVVEIWCHAPPTVIGARYAARVRQRSGGHLGLDYVPELVELAKRAKPTGLFPVIEVDTTAPLPDLGSWLRERLAET